MQPSYVRPAIRDNTPDSSALAAARPVSLDSAGLPARSRGQSGAHNSSYPAFEALAERVDTLWRRTFEIERSLSAQEWWLLGRTLPEARLLAEIVSLFAVARGELESVLTQFFGRSIPTAEQTGQFAQVGEAPAPDENLGAIRAQAVELLRMVAVSLPPMRQYAQTLRAHAERLGAPASALDSLSIVADRFGEVAETLNTPPV